MWARAAWAVVIPVSLRNTDLNHLWSHLAVVICLMLLGIEPPGYHVVSPAKADGILIVKDVVILDVVPSGMRLKFGVAHSSVT